jgi:hypothetical protein
MACWVMQIYLNEKKKKLGAVISEIHRLHNFINLRVKNSEIKNKLLSQLEKAESVASSNIDEAKKIIREARKIAYANLS